MARFLLCVSFCAFLLLPASASAETTRYFAVWSYTQNAPLDEIRHDDLGQRKLGYWKVRFGDDGGVVAASYHSATGVEWLSFRYVEDNGRIFADLYGPTGEFIRRKSTSLETRVPPPDVAGR
jgi:hypothetical protein